MKTWYWVWAMLGVKSQLDINLGMLREEWLGEEWTEIGIWASSAKRVLKVMFLTCPLTWLCVETEGTRSEV